MGEEMDSRSQLIKYALIGLGGIGGGIVVLYLRHLGLVGGIIIGGIIFLIGFGLILSKKDSLIGLIIAGSGACLILSKVPILGALAAFLLTLSGWVLIISGVVGIALFIKNMSGRV